jgi:TonB family protein
MGTPNLSGENTMRNALVAVLALAPVLLHAQASKLVASNALAVAVAPPAAGLSHVSTGVTAPKLIKTVAIQEAYSNFATNRSPQSLVALSFMVDEKGVPTDLKIEQSADAMLDQQVLKAVSQYRYQPGTLDNTPTAVPVMLKVYVRHGN